MLRAVLLLLVLSTTAQAADWQAEMVDYGVYRSLTGGKVDHDNVAGGLMVSYGKQLIKQRFIVNVAPKD